MLGLDYIMELVNRGLAKGKEKDVSRVTTLKILIQKGQNYKITVHLSYTCMIYRHKEALIALKIPRRNGASQVATSQRTARENSDPELSLK